MRSCSRASIRENLRFVRPDATDEECLQVLRQASVDSLLRRADRGLDTVIGEGGVKVSGGEKQRLSIARALLRRPQLLVFDEATSSLDSLTEEEISQTIREVARQPRRHHHSDRAPSLNGHACRSHLRARTRPHRGVRAAMPSCSRTRASTTRCGGSRWGKAEPCRRQPGRAASAPCRSRLQGNALTAQNRARQPAVPRTS